MKSALLTALLLFTPFSLACQAPDFAGSYAMTNAEGGQVLITLQEAGAGTYSGTMSNGGLTWQIHGEPYEDALTGSVDTGQGILAFEAYVDDNGLEFILVEIGPDGMPDVDNGQAFVFARTGAVPQTGDNIVEQSNRPPLFPPVAQATPAGSDPIVGSFSDGQMTLQLQGGNGSYSGQLAVGAEAYPVVVQRNADRLVGTMDAANGQYNFYLTATQDGVAMDNAGEIFALPRVRAAGSPVAPYPPQQSAPQAPPQAPSNGAPSAQGTGQSGAAADSPLAQQWRQVIAGKKVTYISSYSSNSLGGGGMSTKNVYHFCSSGQFAFSDDSSVTLNMPGTPDLGTPGTSDGGSGTWRIITEGQLAGVELRFNSGEVVVYRLDMQDGAVYANGDRVYVTPGEACY